MQPYFNNYYDPRNGGYALPPNLCYNPNIDYFALSEQMQRTNALSAVALQQNFLTSQQSNTAHQIEFAPPFSPSHFFNNQEAEEPKKSHEEIAIKLLTKARDLVREDNLEASKAEIEKALLFTPSKETKASIYFLRAIIEHRQMNLGTALMAIEAGMTLIPSEKIFTALVDLEVKIKEQRDKIFTDFKDFQAKQKKPQLMSHEIPHVNTSSAFKIPNEKASMMHSDELPSPYTAPPLDVPQPSMCRPFNFESAGFLMMSPTPSN